MKEMAVINSKRQRKLVKQKYAPSTTMSFDLPSGEVVKRYTFKVKGYVKHNYASGAPVLNSQRAGICHALFRNISVITDGGVTRKKVDVKWLRDQAKMVLGSDAPAYYQKDANKVDVEVEGFPTIAPTGKKLAFIETFELPMEAIITSASASSYLNLSGKSASVIEIDTHNLRNLLLPSSDEVDSTEYDIDVEISLTTAPHFRGNKFATFRQTPKTVDFKGAQNNTPVELNRGASIAGFWIELLKGQDRIPLTMDEFDRCEFQIVRNGTEVIRHFTGHQLIAENLSGTPIQKALKACGYVSFLNNRSVETALKTGMGSGVQALDLNVTLPSDLDYSYPVSVSIKQDEFIQLD